MGYIVHTAITIEYREITIQNKTIGTACMTVNGQEWFLVTNKKMSQINDHRSFLQAGTNIKIVFGLPFAIQDEFMTQSMTKEKKLVLANELTHLGMYVQKEDIETIYVYEREIKEFEKEI